MKNVHVNLGDRSYPIYVGEGLLSQSDLIEPFLGSGKAVVISNETIAPLYGEQVKELLGDHYAEEIILPDGEEHKHLDTISLIYDRLMAGKYDRNTTLVALGGGVVGDITGFAAATYQRGINFIQIPTTLLAQVDSSVGGKTGVNHPQGKNMIGAFYQPQCVLIDTAVLRSLPQREVLAGLAEVVKYGLIIDAEFFNWLESNCDAVLALESAELMEVITRCCEIKADVVARDERESGIRALLNLGHTFGHAIETASGYGELLHGETVAMGMVMAADLSCRQGWIDAATAARIREVLEEKFGMPVVPPADITIEQYLSLMASDKKAQKGQIRFILLHAIGDAELTADVDGSLLAETLEAADRLCRF